MESKNILNIIENVTFGIEIETCFHIIGKQFNEDAEAIYFYRKCMLKKSEKDGYIEWEGITDYSEKYTKWVVTEDSTVSCKKRYPKITCIKNGQKTDLTNCENIFFYPIEIITPKLIIGKDGLKKLMYTWIGYIYTNNIIYTSNETQGLHINLSHPKMTDKTKNTFLDLWVSFEPIIIQLIPTYRRISIKKYAKPLSSSTNIYKQSQNKHSAVRKGEDRMEIRIGEGSIDFFDVYFWNLFCIILFSYSMMDNSPFIFDYSNNEGKIQAFHSLLKIIYDDSIQRMLLERYRKNKEKEWLNITYRPSGINIIEHPWKTMSEKEHKMMYDLRYIYC